MNVCSPAKDRRRFENDRTNRFECRREDRGRQDLRGWILLLGRFKIFHSHDLGEIERFLRTQAGGELRDARLLSDGGQGLRWHAVVSANFSVSSISNDISATIDFSEVDYLRLVFPTRGRIRIILPKDEFDVTPSDAGYFVPEGLRARKMHPDGYRNLTVRISPNSIRQRLAALCGADVPGSIEFAQPERTDRKFIEFIRHPLFAAARELDTAGPHFYEALMADLESVTVTRLLLFATHNHSPMLQQKAAPPSRLEMSRAEEFIAGNWNKPIDIEGVATASGVSARTILRYFHEKYGETPRAYLRRIRLDKAHQMLLAVGETDSVVAIALKCGFSSLGHFAESYRRRFGELPSATLKGRK